MTEDATHLRRLAEHLEHMAENTDALAAEYRAKAAEYRTRLGGTALTGAATGTGTSRVAVIEDVLIHHRHQGHGICRCGHETGIGRSLKRHLAEMVEHALLALERAGADRG